MKMKTYYDEREDDYYRFTFLFQFKHPTIRERYELSIHRTKMNRYVLISLCGALLSTIPITVQWKALIGRVGIMFGISSLFGISAYSFFALRAIIELYYETIEKMEQSSRRFCYKLKTYTNATFIISFAITLGTSMYAKCDVLCGENNSWWETHFCNNMIPFNGHKRMPMDSFVFLIFLSLILYHLFPMPFVYTFATQIVLLTSIIAVIIKTFEVSLVIFNFSCLLMYLGVVTIQFYMQYVSLDYFILKDKVKTFEMKEKKSKYYLSKIEDSRHFRSGESSDQSLDATIYYDTMNQPPIFYDDRIRKTRARSFSNSTISSVGGESFYQ